MAEYPEDPAHELIQFVGVNKLPAEKRQLVSDLSTEYYGKIKREVKNLTSVVVHLKEYNAEGKRSKCSVTIRVITPGKVFESGKTSDFDFPRSIHKAFDDILTQVQKLYKEKKVNPLAGK